MRANRFVVAAAALLTAAPAFSYSLIGWDWAWQSDPLSTPFKINPSSFPSYVGSQTDITNALQDAQELWATEGGADFEFTYGGTTTQTSWTTDGVFITQFSSSTISGGTLAISQSWGWNDDMTECDQRFYRSNAYGTISWSADPAGASWSEFDLQYTAMHEYGHCAGLNHSSTSSAVMYGSATGGEGPGDRHLHNDDENGLQAMYGAAAGGGGGGLALNLNGTIRSGQSHMFIVTGANPGETVYLLYSTMGVGSGPCPPVLGGSICLGVKAPAYKLAQGVANGFGTANITTSIPATWGGWTVGYQSGVIRGAGGTSSVLSAAAAATTL